MDSGDTEVLTKNTALTLGSLWMVAVSLVMLWSGNFLGPSKRMACGAGAARRSSSHVVVRFLITQSSPLKGAPNGLPGPSDV